MDEPGRGPEEGEQGRLERLLLAAVGAVALTAESAEALAEALVERGGLRRDDARQTVDDLRGRWRGDAQRLTVRGGASMAGLLREAGLVLRSEYEELELRVAQLEHRLRLVEGGGPQNQRALP